MAVPVPVSILALVLPIAQALLATPAPPAPPAAPAPAPSLRPPPPAPAPLPALGPRPRLRAVRTPLPIVIDGKLDDAAWRLAIPSDTFTQHQPSEGAPPSERTEVRVLYDDQAIYVGIDCWQLHAPIVRRLMRRDRELPSDGVWFDIDSRRDGVSAFHFGINAAGSLIDAIHFNDVDYSSAWDETWQARVADTPQGYSAEFRIPLRVLRFDALPAQDFGLQVRRFIDARQEYDDWAFYPRNAAGYVRYFGRLEGLADLRQGSPVELRPFALGRLRARQDPGDGTRAFGNDWHATAGLDAKAHVTPELTLDLAVNPDFGQVEADTVVLNLSTFETFFPEKRPFFLEGSDLWNAQSTLVYTRRIGHQPSDPALAAGEVLLDHPEPSPIYAAAKLSGTIRGRTTVGLLTALTGRNDADVLLAGGQTSARRLVDPYTLYSAARLRQIVAGGTEIGFLGTATNRFEPAQDPAAPCPGSGLVEAVGGRCLNDAYVASVDGRWRSRSGDYAALGQATASLLAGGPPRSQRDGIAIEPGHPSGAGSLWVGKQGGRRWLWDVTQVVSGRQFEVNDLGYLDRKNDYTLNADVVYRSTDPWWVTLDSRSALTANWRTTLDGLNLDSSVQLETSATLRGYSGVYADVLCRADHFDDRETGDGAALERAGSCGADLFISSDPRRRLVAYAGGQYQRLRNGTHAEARGQLTLRLLPQLEFDLLPTFVYSSGEPRYIATTTTDAGTIYTFGRQLARSVGATVRAAYTLTPELSLQAYGQVFLASLHYPDFQMATRTGFRQRVHLADLARADPPVPNPDVTRATLNVNIVLRWEYRLGSTLFLVYTRAQTPPTTVVAGTAGSLDLGRLTRGGAAADVIMLKLSYSWG
ncbi:MAG TPA: DUF5916 domain-containing protein [Polyangia bacterium]|nr:DUF5916 domain-containing protein [Polyangia bacterium]